MPELILPRSPRRLSQKQRENTVHVAVFFCARSSDPENTRSVGRLTDHGECDTIVATNTETAPHGEDPVYTGK
jgi:hypothetical protein